MKKNDLLCRKKQKNSPKSRKMKKMFVILIVSIYFCSCGFFQNLAKSINEMGYSEVCVAEPLAVYEDFVQNLRDSASDLKRPVFKISFVASQDEINRKVPSDSVVRVQYYAVDRLYFKAFGLLLAASAQIYHGQIVVDRVHFYGDSFEYIDQYNVPIGDYFITRKAFVPRNISRLEPITIFGVSRYNDTWMNDSVPIEISPDIPDQQDSAVQVALKTLKKRRSHEKSQDPSIFPLD